MKRLAAVFLALAMLLSLCACTGGKPTESQAPTEPSSSGTEQSAAPEQSTAPEDQPVEISIANYDQTNSFTVQCIQAFIDYATEASGGSITFKTYYGATLCSMMEEYEYLKSGSVDMVAMLPPFCMSELPYVYAVNNIKDDADIVAYTDWLWFENEETAAIIDKYCTQAGVVLLGSVDAGTSIICSNYEAAGYADMSSGKLGCGRDFDVYAELGLNPVNVDPTESYDALNRGVCNALSYTPSSYYSTAIYEVAPYCLSLNVYGNSNTYMFSLEKWNSLSANQQQILRDAMDAAQAFSIQGNIDGVEDAKSVAAGWNDISAEESEKTCQLMETAVATMLLGSSDQLGTTEDMLKILEAKESYSGIPCIPDSYRK